MFQKILTFSMAITAIVSLLLSDGVAKAALLNGGSTFRDGDTLFVLNREGEHVSRPIVNMTMEFEIPGTAHKINIPGAIEQVIEFVNAAYPDYDWHKDENPNANTPQVSPEDNTVYCNVGKQGSYYTASFVKSYLRQFGSHKMSVGPGPGNCARAACNTDDYHQTVAFYFCNDDVEQVRPTFDDVADLAQIVMDRCVEFGTPFAWVRGQAFHAHLPWNVIVTSEHPCDSVFGKVPKASS